MPTGGLISGFAGVPVHEPAIVIDSTPMFRIRSSSLLPLLDPGL